MPEDLERIEAKMRELAGPGSPLRAPDLAEARRPSTSFTKRGEPLKVQLIQEKTEGQSDVSCYTIKDRETFVDFCVGPHVPSTGRLKAFKLLSTSNAYWKGDARNQPMQRIYGTAFFKEDDLKQHLVQIEEAKKRDHRKLGKELGLFTVNEPWAPGCRSGSEGRDRSPTARGLHPREGACGGLQRRLHADLAKVELCDKRRGTGSTTTRTCSLRWISKTEAAGAAADELPAPHL